MSCGMPIGREADEGGAPFGNPGRIVKRLALSVRDAVHYALAIWIVRYHRC
jgi:hypothetical protein